MDHVKWIVEEYLKNEKSLNDITVEARHKSGKYFLDCNVRLMLIRKGIRMRSRKESCEITGRKRRAINGNT